MNRPAAIATGRNLVALVAALRGGGARIGSAALLDANAALAVVGPERREDVCAALRCALIRDPADLELFQRVFDHFFASAAGPGGAALRLPGPPPKAPPAVRRLADGTSGQAEPLESGAEHRPAFDAAATQSARERLMSKDFEQMSAAELRQVLGLTAAARAPAALRRSRRLSAATGAGQLDLRRMMQGRSLERPLYKTRVLEPRDCVLLIDISGSMSVYSRQFLHFAHALGRREGRIETFVFATRLSRITREMAHRDPDVAVGAAARAAPDWDGGTRLGECMREFNQIWSRRVLGRGARLVLLSDGLEREGIEALEREAVRLARAVHEFIWINPLLRHPGYQPLAQGAAVLARVAHRQCPAHNLLSLRELERLLG